MTDKSDEKFVAQTIAFLLFLFVLAIFAQACRFEFLTFDDDVYVTANRIVQAGLTGPGIRWALTTFSVSNWTPLTWISHMADCQIFGLRPSGHHAVNVLFHAANAVLLFTLLRRMTGALAPSAGVAILFAIHPLHVESVAWVAERKDVLSTFLWLLAAWFYVLYVERPSWTRKAAVVCLFALSLTAKPMGVTLPFLLILLDYWPLRRFAAASDKPVPAQRRRGSLARTLWHLVWEKAPLFALSAASCILTIAAQAQNWAIASLDLFTFRIRLENTVVAYGTYLMKTVWPHDLSVACVHRGEVLPGAAVVASAFLLTIVTALAIHGLARRPYLAVGWFWYLGTLVPVVGFVQASRQAIADRYTYVPLIGIFVMAAWGIDEAARRGVRWRRAAMGLSVAAVVALTGCTWHQLGYWRSSVALFEHALSVDKDNSIAHNNLGTALAALGRYDDAAGHFARAYELEPGNIDALNNQGAMLLVQDKPVAAAAVFRQVLQRTPEDATVYSNLGVALYYAGDLPGATANLTEAQRRDPHCLKARQILNQLQGAPLPPERTQ